MSQLDRLEWYAIHSHELLHEIASDTEEILQLLAKQPGSMTAEEVARVTARAIKIHRRLAAITADKPK